MLKGTLPILAKNLEYARVQAKHHANETGISWTIFMRLDQTIMICRATHAPKEGFLEQVDPDEDRSKYILLDYNTIRYKLDPQHAVVCEYTNHRGIIARRMFIPLPVPPEFSSSPYHPGPVYTIEVYDLIKRAVRSFALKDIRGWTETPQ